MRAPTGALTGALPDSLCFSPRITCQAKAAAPVMKTRSPMVRTQRRVWMIGVCSTNSALRAHHRPMLIEAWAFPRLSRFCWGAYHHR